MIALLVVLILVGVGLYIVSLIPMDQTVRKIIYALAILLIVLWVLSLLGLIPANVLHSRPR